MKQEQAKRTHIRLPAETKCPRNLVTKRRAPVSTSEGTICLGFLLRRSQLFPRMPFAAAIPACKMKPYFVLHFDHNDKTLP